MTTSTAGDTPSTATIPQPYFLLDLIEVRKEMMQRFITLMYQLIPVFEENGWILMSATYTLTGRPSTVVHLWMLPSADSLRNTMVKLSENSAYLDLQDTIKSEDQNLLSRMPYDPQLVKEAADAKDDVNVDHTKEGDKLEMEDARVPGDRATDVMNKLKNLVPPAK